MNHKATWPQNAVTFNFDVNDVASLSWSFDKEPFILDFEMQEAALAQLQKAYGFEVHYPDTEHRILTMLGSSPEEIENGRELFFSWSPPLPEPKKTTAQSETKQSGLSSELAVVAELFQNGLLTEEEFRIAKIKILEQ